MTPIHTIAAAFALAAGFALPAAAAEREWNFFMYPYKGEPVDQMVTATQAQGWDAFMYRYKGGSIDPVITGSAKPSAGWEGVLIAADTFMTIHLNNQKIGSEVFAYWHPLVAAELAVQPDGFMAIYMDNQKVGSDIWKYWHATGAVALKCETQGTE